MKKKLKEAWLEALRSGQFHQGKYVLRDYHSESENGRVFKYCPLGILCVLTGHTPESWYNVYPKVDMETYIEKSDAVSSVYHGISQFEGISPKDQVEIADMNDRGLSFLEIANWIEKHL